MAKRAFVTTGKGEHIYTGVVTTAIKWAGRLGCVTHAQCCQQDDTFLVGVFSVPAQTAAMVSY